MEVQVISESVIKPLQQINSYEAFVKASLQEISINYRTEADKIMSQPDVSMDVKLAELNKLKNKLVKERTQSDITKNLKEASGAIKEITTKISETLKDYEAGIREIETDISKPLVKAKEAEEAIKKHYIEATDWLNQTIGLMADPSNYFSKEQLDSIKDRLGTIEHPEKKPDATIVALTTSLNTLLTVKASVAMATSQVQEDRKEPVPEIPKEDSWIEETVSQAVAEQEVDTASLPNSPLMESYIDKLINSLDNVKYRDAVIDMRTQFERNQLGHNTINIGNALEIVVNVLKGL